MRERLRAAVGSVGTAVGGLTTRSKRLVSSAGPHLGRAAYRAKSLAYRALRRHPSTAVDDSVLADRIRSTIGPLEKQLHSSRVNVTVEHGVAILHGNVGSPEAAARIEDAVRNVAGVRDIRSHLSD